jgi:hypothetical protein
MPRKFKKLRLPSKLLSLHSDTWNIIFSYLDQENIRNLITDIPYFRLKFKSNKEIVKSIIQSQLPREIFIGEGTIFRDNYIKKYRIWGNKYPMERYHEACKI